jgi:hypothetical protein
VGIRRCVSTFRDGLFAFGRNRSHSASHSGFSTHLKGNPALAVKRAIAVSNRACSPFDHPGSVAYPEKEGWRESNESERRARLNAREEDVASEKAGLGARVDGNDALVDGGYMGWEYGPTDSVDAS